MPVTVRFKEQEEGKTAHAPGVAHLHARMAGLDRMQMKKHVGKNRHNAVTGSIRVTVAENGFPNLAFRDGFFNRFGRRLLRLPLSDCFFQFVQHA